MKRKIIEVDEDKCTGCSMCIPNCQEGALQIIDEKARLISDLFCDGLGACIGHCPEGAMKVVEREAEEYDERRVMIENIIPKGKNTIKAHLQHLSDHGAKKFLQEALKVLEEKNIENPMEVKKMGGGCGGGYPGSKTIQFEKETERSEEGVRSSQLRQWPVQMHLISPMAPYFDHADVLFAADCTAYSMGDFHKEFIKGKALAIACPKLDSNLDMYVEKLTSMIDDAKINTLTVAIMEVPCCGGLIQIAKEALSKSKRKIPIKKIIIGIKGNIISEEWV